MKFRYYITNLFDGCVEGTNAIQVALDYSVSSDFFVVDSETGEWLTETGERRPVNEAGEGDDVTD